MRYLGYTTRFYQTRNNRDFTLFVPSRNRSSRAHRSTLAKLFLHSPTSFFAHTAHRPTWIRVNFHLPTQPLRSYIPTIYPVTRWTLGRPSSRSRMVLRGFIARALPSRRGLNNLPDLINHAWRGSSSSGAGAERPPHTTVPPPWDARFRVDVEGLTVAVAAARHYSRRSGASTRSPGHVLAGRKAPPIARPSGRAQEDPELAPSGWPAHQAQPLPWLFPNFRACGASSSLLSCPTPRPSSRHRSPSSLPSRLPPCNPASSRLSSSL